MPTSFRARVVLASLAVCCASAGEPARAPEVADPARRAEAIEDAERLLRLAELDHRLGDYERAAIRYARVLASFEANLPPEHPHLDTVRNNLAVVALARGDAAQAKGLLERVLQVREATLAPGDPRIATSLDNLALVYASLGAYDRARPLYTRAIRIQERALGPDHPELGRSLSRLGSLHLELGEFARAEASYRRALEIGERALGADDPRLAEPLVNLAILEQQRAEYARSEALFKRALALLEARLPADHPHIANALANFGRMYAERGDYARAAPRFERALGIREREFGEIHREVALSLQDLARVYAHEERTDEAEALFARALTAAEQALGGEHVEVALALTHLADLYRSTGRRERAKPLYRRALAIYEHAVGAEHPAVATVLNNLGELERADGELERARALYRRALETWKATLGPSHPGVAVALHNLGATAWAAGELPAAAQLFERGNAVRERSLEVILASGSEEQKLAYLATFAVETDATLSLHGDALRDDPAALRLAFETVLRRKGRVLDIVSAGVAQVRRGRTPEDRELLERLAGARARLASLALRGPGRDELALHRARVAALEEHLAELESALHGRGGATARPLELDLERVQRALPSDAALIEWAVYRPFDPRAATDREVLGAPRYVAYLLRPEGAPRFFDLGPADVIEREVAAFREALVSPRRRARLQRLARQLEERLLRPLREASPGASHLLLSPDGALHLLPFAALVDEDERLLLERFTLTYLATGRDLLRAPAVAPGDATGSAPPVVIANPDFDAAAPATGETAARRGTAALAPDLAGVRFAPLPGTAGEAEALARILPGVRVLTGARASEAALKRLAGPPLLHVATHGFFLSAAAGGGGGLELAAGGAGATGPRARNPLLRSGIALSGANRRDTAGEDGVLTALEASGLDLRGTQLVVLSACETGLGRIEVGEGVFGLRRALTTAGAESQVISLWKVADEPTRDLMVAYYRRLMRGEGRSQALRGAQLELRATSPHPFFWASFIPSGSWQPLRRDARAGR